VHPSEWEPSLITEGRKEVIGTTTRTLQNVTYPEYPSLRKTVGALGQKKKKKQKKPNKS
jgi:hypothetical protein